MPPPPLGRRSLFFFLTPSSSSFMEMISCTSCSYKDKETLRGTRRRDFISSARVPNSIKSSASTRLHLDRSCSVHTPLSIVRIISTTVGAHLGAWRLSSHDANGLYSLLHLFSVALDAR